MNYKERTYLEQALFYKKEYKDVPWYMFKKRYFLYKKWQKSLILMINSQ